MGFGKLEEGHVASLIIPHCLSRCFLPQAGSVERVAMECQDLAEGRLGMWPRWNVGVLVLLNFAGQEYLGLRRNMLAILWVRIEEFKIKLCKHVLHLEGHLSWILAGPFQVSREPTTCTVTYFLRNKDSSGWFLVLVSTPPLRFSTMAVVCAW